MKKNPLLGVGVILMIAALAFFLRAVTISVTAPTPIEKAIATCGTPDQQPQWVTGNRGSLETTRYLYYEDYTKNGRVEIWGARVKSAVYTDSDGSRVKLDFVSNDFVGVMLEYHDNWGAHWEQPTLSTEEYTSYYSMGQALLALYGGDEKWRETAWVYYTLLFAPSDNQLISVDCPNGARWDLSLLDK